MADTLHLGRTRFVPVQSRGEVEVYEHIVWPYRLALPLMTMLAAYVHVKKFLCALIGYKPRHNCLFGDGLSVNGAKVRDGAARWPALDAIYNFRDPEGRTVLHRWLDSWWMNIRNAQAVRNRLKIAKRELKQAIMLLSKPGLPVTILSLAAGSAQGVIESIAECGRLGVDVRAHLLDQDETALRYARGLSRKWGVEDKVTVTRCNVMHFEKEMDGARPDIIEMMGLIDYFSDLSVQILFKKIWRHLKPGGRFFTCHIHENNETYFMRHVINWVGMRYRSREQLQDLLVAGGFLTPRLLTEPHGIHTIAVAQKIV